jgi:Icc-related predicted phosphoesterase
VIIDCVSDLHGHFPELLGGDLLIVAGDLTARDQFKEYCDAFQWIAKANYRKKILVAGNHDNLLQTDDWIARLAINFDYLYDSGTEFEGLKIWGSPWTTTFPGMNPHCMAFTVNTDEELAEKWALIPDDIDILITHSPPYGILDQVMRERYEEGMSWDEMEPVGSLSLRNICLTDYRKLHVFGHIHEWGGKILPTVGCRFVNASHVNERYQPVNKPIRIELHKF